MTIAGSGAASSVMLETSSTVRFTPPEGNTARPRLAALFGDGTAGILGQATMTRAAGLHVRDEADQEWLARVRIEAESGFAGLDRGEGTRGTVDEHMARIDAAVRARAVARTGR